MKKLLKNDICGTINGAVIHWCDKSAEKVGNPDQKKRRKKKERRENAIQNTDARFIAIQTGTLLKYQFFLIFLIVSFSSYTTIIINFFTSFSKYWIVSVLVYTVTVTNL